MNQDKKESMSHRTSNTWESKWQWKIGGDKGWFSKSWYQKKNLEGRDLPWDQKGRE